jgi:Golgi to ER traffic protein 4
MLKTCSCAVITTCAKEGKVDEQDLFRTRAILQVLAAASKKTSYKQLEDACALRKHLNSKGTPLDNFSELLLAALGKGSAALFDVAQEEYASVLQQDETFDELLSRINCVYLGRGGGGGGLGDLLGSLFGGV